VFRRNPKHCISFILMQNIRRTEVPALLKEMLFATDILVLDLKKKYHLLSSFAETK